VFPALASVKQGRSRVDGPVGYNDRVPVKIPIDREAVAAFCRRHRIHARILQP